MIKKILFSLCLGCIITIFFMQDDTWFKNLIGSTFAHIFKNALHCNISYKVKSIRFLEPEIIFKNVTVTSNDNSKWFWKAKEYKTRFTLWNLLFYGEINMNVELQDFCAESDMINGKVAILPHIQRILSGLSIGIKTTLKQVIFKNGLFNIYDRKNGTHCSFSWHSESKRFNRILKSSVYLQDGFLSIGDRNFLHSVNGNIHAELTIKPDIKINHLYCACNVNLTQLLGKNNDTLSFFSGKIEDDQGLFTLNSSDNTLQVDPIKINSSDNKAIGSCRAHFPLSYLAHLTKMNKYGIEGNCSLAVLANLSDLKKGIHGHLAIKDIFLDNRSFLKHAQLTFNQKAQACTGAVRVKNDEFEFGGSFKWDQEAKKVAIDLSNSSLIEVIGLPYWAVMPQDIEIVLHLNENSLDGSYKCVGTNRKIDDTISVQGLINGDYHSFTLEGGIGEKNFDATVLLMPHTLVKNFTLSDQDKNRLLSVNADQKGFNGTIGFPLIKQALSPVIKEIQGEGEILISGSSDQSGIKAQMNLNGGAIRLPQTYNFISEFNMNMNLHWKKKKITFSNLLLQLHKGKVTCTKATCLFNNQWQPEYIHAPVLFDTCLLNFQKDLFTVVSGNLVFNQYKKKTPHIKGRVILERSQLKENLFSSSFQKKLINSNAVGAQIPSLSCDIVFESKDPVRVKTSVLETNAKVNLALSGLLSQPNLSGSIILNSGAICFPYKPLFITKGAIYFMGSPDEAVIELVAKNKIRTFNVSMYVNGSLLNPHIMLESAPALSEEQIIGLVLVGSHEESLNMMMPALVMQNIQNMIFNSETSLPTHPWYRMLRPFKHIHLVPSFSDQTGRGGLRGAIEITVGDRWRAMIQKNFSLTEDTLFEVEYLLSDDISLRGFRTERRDVGGEVEMRWKF